MSKPDDRGEVRDSLWWQVLDVVVWVAVAAVVIIGAEMLIGKVLRERIAAGASRYLRSVSPADDTTA